MAWLRKQSKSSLSWLSSCGIQAAPSKAHYGVCGPSVIRSVKSTRWDGLSISVSGSALAPAYPRLTYNCRNLSSPARISVVFRQARCFRSGEHRPDVSQRLCAPTPSRRGYVEVHTNPPRAQGGFHPHGGADHSPVRGLDRALCQGQQNCSGYFAKGQREDDFAKK
jgi:hypothetical protein